jgi:capsular polysaccharide biosynthesis protein
MSQINPDPHRPEVEQPYPRSNPAAALAAHRRLPSAHSTYGRIFRYAIFAAILAVLGVIAALAVGASLGDRFSATSQVLVRAPDSSETIVTGNPAVSEDIQRVVDTDLQIAQSRDFLSRVAAHINNGSVSTDSLVKDLTIATTGDADLIAFTASEPDAQSAQAVATTAASEFVAYIKSVQEGTLNIANSQDPAVIAAQTRLELLQQLAPTAAIASPASSSTQLRPNHPRDGLIGLTGGLVVAVVGIALGETVLNRRRVADAAVRSI